MWTKQKTALRLATLRSPRIKEANAVPHRTTAMDWWHLTASSECCA
jgi:hypothetical protein